MYIYITVNQSNIQRKLNWDEGGERGGGGGVVY